MKNNMEYLDNYEKENLRQIRLKINRKTDPEMLEWIEKHENIQGYIKQLIRRDMTIEPVAYPPTRYADETFGCSLCKHEVTKEMTNCNNCGVKLNWNEV